MLVRTVVTSYSPDDPKEATRKLPLIQAEMVKLGLAQNTALAVDLYTIQGDWVDPEQLGMNHKAYLRRTLTLQHGVGCHAHVEVS
jgi:hypothetical protein